MEVFKDLQTTGNTFLATFERLPSRQGQLVIADISRELGSLQQITGAYNGGDGFDLITATNIAAEMETLAEHIDYDIRHWLRNSSESQGRSILQLSSQFKTNTNRLYNTITSRRPREEVRQITSTVYDDWRRIAQVLRRAPEEDLSLIHI